MAGVGLRIMYGKFRFLRGTERKWRDAIREVHQVIDGWIDNELSNPSREAKEQTDQTILVRELVKENVSRVELRSQLLNVFFPARDTTAIAISNIFFNLARYPRVWTKLRSEVLQSSESLTYDSLQSLKYMRCVINESKSQCQYGNLIKS